MLTLLDHLYRILYESFLGGILNSEVQVQLAAKQETKRGAELVRGSDT